MTALIAIAGLLHVRYAAMRSGRLLEHDEAISLIAAAGSAARVDALHACETSLQSLRAGELQAFLRPSAQDGFAGVLHSLAEYDIHPPLYFVLLHAAQRAGIESQAVLRLLGFLPLLAAAWAANRWIWPGAAAPLALLATAWLLLSPFSLQVATALRQYAFVLCGTMLSFAALAALGEATTSRTARIALLTVAPLLLLYSQFGTLPWVILHSIAAGFLAWRGGSSQRVALGVSLGLQLILLAPLLIWWMGTSHGPGAAPARTGWHIFSGVVRPLLASLGSTYFSLPARWHGTMVWTLSGLGLFCLVALQGAVRRRPIDRWIALTVPGWTIIWAALLMEGRIPAHAASAKYLGPLLLAPLILLSRTGRDLPAHGPLVNPASPAIANKAGIARRIALPASILSVSLASHALGHWQYLFAPNHAASLQSFLRSADCLLADQPKRGYLLPLVAQMRPDARVVLASPEAALRDWGHLERLLPTGRLLLAEIDSIHDGVRSPGARQLLSRLERRFGPATALRSEPRRTVHGFGMDAPGAPE